MKRDADEDDEIDEDDRSEDAYFLDIFYSFIIFICVPPSITLNSYEF